MHTDRVCKNGRTQQQKKKGQGDIEPERVKVSLRRPRCADPAMAKKGVRDVVTGDTKAEWLWEK